jgi:hypothetical protein
MNQNKLAGWCGIVFSFLSLIVLPMALPPPPPLGASGAQLAEWFGSHHWGFLVGNYLGILAFFPGFVQLAVFSAEVKKRDDGWLWMLVLTTGAFAYAVFACSLCIFQALPLLAGAVAFAILGTLANVWFALDGLAALPLVLAVAWAVRRTGALPRWMVPLSGVVALLSLAMSIGALVSSPPWLAGGGVLTALGFIAFFVWITAWAAAMLRQGRVS